MNKHEENILRALIDNLGVAGFKPAAVWAEETYVMAGLEEHDQAPELIQRPMTADEVVEVFNTYDMYAPTVHFTHQHKTTWGNVGVMVVEGNRCDFISNWHCGDEAFDKIVESVSEASGEGVYE